MKRQGMWDGVRCDGTGGCHCHPWFPLDLTPRYRHWKVPASRHPRVDIGRGRARTGAPPTPRVARPTSCRVISCPARGLGLLEHKATGGHGDVVSYIDNRRVDSSRVSNPCNAEWEQGPKGGGYTARRVHGTAGGVASAGVMHACRGATGTARHLVVPGYIHL